MQPVSRKMQTNEETDMVQGCSSYKTLSFSALITSQGCVLRVDQPQGCKNKSACPIQLKWDLEAGGQAGCPQHCLGQCGQWR